ncbi:MAG TPA: TonB-dependent receptor [Sphingomonas sp.]
MPAFLAMTCVGAFAASPATAAEPSAPDAATAPASNATDPILVTGKQAKAELSSSKSTAALIDTPQTITVIPAKVLQQENLLTLRDALSTLPGITFGAGEGGGGYGDSINLRGYSANTDITIDGVRDSAQYSRTETFNVEQIEVYNGANSVFNGSGSVGGTINIAQKMPKTGNLTTIGAGIGTDSYYRGTVDANHMLSDTVAFRLNAVIHRNDVPGRDVEDYKRWGIAPSVTIGIGTPTRLTFMYVHQHDNNVPQYGVPYYPADGGLPDGADYKGYYGYKNLDEQRSTFNQLSMIFEHDFNDHVSIRNLTRYENIRQLTIVDPPQGTYCLADTGLTPTGGSCKVTVGNSSVTVPPGYYLASGPRGNLRDTRNELGYDQLDLHVDARTGILEHNVVAGAAATWERFGMDTGNVERAADGSNPYANTGLPLINIGDPSANGGNVYTGPVNYVPSARQEGQRTDYAVYLFDTTRIGKMFEVNFGVRWEHNSGSFRADAYNTTAGPLLGAVTEGTTFHNSADLFSYRGGIVFKPVDYVSIYASYGNSKTPSISTVNGSCTTGTGASLVDFCDVKPEAAKNYEVGVKADLLDRKLELTAAAFRNERSNFKVSSNDPTLPAQQVPDGKSRVDGIALGATGNITKAWTVFANYTYLKSKVLQGVSDRCVANPTASDCVSLIAAAPEAGGPLQQTPKHSGSLLTSYTLPFGLQLGYGLTYQGKFAIATNPSAKINGHYPESHPYLTHRLFAAYEIREGLTAQVNIQNLTNKHYYTSIRNNGWAEPGALRSGTFTLTCSF